MGIGYKKHISLIISAVLVSVVLLYSNCSAATVALSWDANTESTLAGYKVYYQADSSALPFQGTGAGEGASPVEVHNQTMATISGLDPGRTYYFAITAYDIAGIESSYSNIVTVPESTPPTVTLSSPTNNTIVSGMVYVAATASDNVGVTKVEYYVNNVLMATVTTSPYVYHWDTSTLAIGTFTLLAKAYDTAGNSGQSSRVSVAVVNDTTPPTVSLTAPANNAILSGIVTISAAASDNVGVSKVEFYRNGTLSSASNVSPYSYNWDTSLVANGSYILTAKAYDNSGNSAQYSNVSVTVNNVIPDTTPPAVSLTAPANNAILSGIVTISAAASDNIGVSKVEFYRNGTFSSASNVSPYSYNWDTRLVANGSYILTAKAYDNSGNSAQYSNVSVTVNNASYVLSDALLALQIGSGKVMPTVEQANRLDVAPVVNGISAPDGVVNTGDAIILLSKIVGKPIM